MNDKEMIFRKKCILIIFSIILSIVLFLGKHYIYSGIIYGNINENHVKEISIVSLFIIPIMSLLVYFAILFLNKILIFVEHKLKSKNKTISRKKSIIIKFILVLILLAFWSPYLLTYYPGAIYSDGFSSIGQSLTGVYTNHHPILYTFFVKIFVDIGIKINNLDLGIYLYTIIQTVIMAAVMSYFLIWLYRNGISKLYIILCGVFIALYPLFPFYAVTLWKDTLFSLCLFLYLLYHIDIVATKGGILYSVKGIIKYCLLTFLVVFLRNNGMYITIFTWFFLLITYRKNIKKNLKSFLIVTITFFIAVNIVQGPIYKKIGFTTEFAESVGVPIQQLARVISLDGNYNTEQKEFIDHIFNIEGVKENYKPCIVDPIKFNYDIFNSTYLEEHKGEFIKVWVELFFKNPKIYWDAFLMENIGYWNINASGPEAYVQAGIWPNSIGIKQIDYFNKFTGVSLASYVYPKHFISSGFLFWIIMISMMITILRGKYKMVISFLPIIALWLTLMIASPIGISLRYTYIMFLVMPLILVWPAVEEKNKSY